MARLTIEAEKNSVLPAAVGNGSPKKGQKKAAPKVKPPGSRIGKKYKASIHYCGDPPEIPPEFVRCIKDLERKLGMPVWLLVQNGNGKHCQVDIGAFKGFQKLKAQIVEDQPVALLLESPGGFPEGAYYIARLFQRRSRNFITIVPQYAKSAATLIAVAGSRIIMGRDAELGPLDVQIYDSNKERYGSALNTIQSLERLNAVSLTAIDQTMQLLAIRTGKKLDVLLPNVFSYVSHFMRPLIEKIDAVDYSEKARALKMAEEYATRLMKRNYPEAAAEQMARQLVEGYADHGFIVDAEEASALVLRPDKQVPVGLKIEVASVDMERIFDRLIPFLDKLTILGRLQEV